MKLFDFLRSKFSRNSLEKEDVSVQTAAPVIPIKAPCPQKRYGKSHSQEVSINRAVKDSLCKTFIAFDVETTGLSPYQNRVIEVGAVIFVDRKPVKSFSSLIDAGVHVPEAASNINHITDKMLKTAPSEKTVYPQLIEFLGNAVYGNPLLCAHNAKFDFDFLDQTLSRLGYDTNIRYVDTLHLSRSCLHGLKNYKQGTLEEYFGFNNRSSHRAVSDAENCGKILCSLLDRANEIIEDDESRTSWEIWANSGQPFWLQGEQARKAGNFDEAIVFFDQAKKSEYVFPFLFESYAKIYRKLREYTMEILILDEGIERIGTESCAELIVRRDKAMALLDSQKQAERMNAEKERIRAERVARKARERENAASKPRCSSCKAIIQMDDEGTVIREFPSISAAEKEIGISSKSIRDAANGVQKHAGGYRWRFKDKETSIKIQENESNRSPSAV